MLQKLVSKIVQNLRPGDDQSGLRIAQNQQGIPRLNAEQLPGLLRNDDLPPVAHPGGAEDPFCFAFAENVFSSGHGDPS